jgi:hypothetical protein
VGSSRCSRSGFCERFSFSEKVLVFPWFLAFGELFQNIFRANLAFFGVLKRARGCFLGENEVYRGELFPRGGMVDFGFWIEWWILRDRRRSLGEGKTS